MRVHTSLIEHYMSTNSRKCTRALSDDTKVSDAYENIIILFCYILYGITKVEADIQTVTSSYSILLRSMENHLRKEGQDFKPSTISRSETPIKTSNAERQSPFRRMQPALLSSATNTRTNHAVA